jgi:L-threonylcarbamoyladenylate synthase
MEKAIDRSVEILKKGGTILYPTDTIWGIGCDATNYKAAQKVLKIKNRPQNFSFIILVEKAPRIVEYVEEIPDITWDLLSGFDLPVTVIYPKAKNLPKNVIARDGSIAIRVVKNEFCKKVIAKFGKPIVSSSANLSGENSPVMFKDISDKIKEQVDFIVPIYHDKLSKTKASTIIKLKLNGEFDIIRQ